jgi:hypothetical protein
LTLPASVAEIDEYAFSEVKGIQRVELLGSPLAPALVRALERKLARDAQVVGAALAGQRFGRFTIGKATEGGAA